MSDRLLTRMIHDGHTISILRFSFTRKSSGSAIATETLMNMRG